MKKKWIKITVFLFVLFAGSTSVYSRDEFGLDEKAYSIGYREGYSHGVADKMQKLDFGFRAETGFRTNISEDSEANEQFRDGYEDGYTDGYYQEITSRTVLLSFDSEIEASRIGYKQGYNHGVIDRETGLGFNFRHNHQFQSGISADSSADVQFLAGYEKGYNDGYYAEIPNNHQSTLPASTASAPRPVDGFITAFSDDHYDGKIQQFQAGRYPKLKDGWNDSVGSIRVFGNVRVILFEDDDFEGKQLVVEQDIDELDDFNFNDKTGSLIVEVRN